MKRLSIYYTPTHFSVTIQNGVTRETSGQTPAETIQAMPAEDRAALEAFCRAVLEFKGTGTFPLEQ